MGSAEQLTADEAPSAGSPAEGGSSRLARTIGARRRPAGFVLRPAGFVLRLAGAALRLLGSVLRMALIGVLAGAVGLMAWAVLPLAVGWHGQVILSGSMRPAINPGDVVLAVPTDPSKLRPGVAVVFRDPARPGRVDVHRVVRRNGDGTFTTRGDANTSDDSTPVPAANILGLPRLRVPWVGLPRYWLHQRDYVEVAVTALVFTAAMWAALTRPRNRIDMLDETADEFDLRDGFDPET